MINPVEQDEINFVALIERIKSAQQSRSFFLNTDFKVLQSVSKKKYGVTLFNFYRMFCFFPDDEIKRKLLSTGLLEDDLIYFTPLQDILKELYNIWKDENIFKAKTRTLDLIKDHYEIKIWTIILRRMGFVKKLNGKNVISAKKILYNLKRRRIDGIKNSRKRGLKNFRSVIDELYYNLLLIADKITDTPTENEDMMLELSDGNTKTFLRSIVECHDYQGMGKDAFLRKFYQLFRLIIKDGPYLPDEAGFYDLKGYVEKSFAAFQTKKVRDIVY
jgi:hypothetical protein